MSSSFINSLLPWFERLCSLVLLGYLPRFGPCFINFYGSTREYSDLPDEFQDLNLGVVSPHEYIRLIVYTLTVHQLFTLARELLISIYHLTRKPYVQCDESLRLRFNSRWESLQLLFQKKGHVCLLIKSYQRKLKSKQTKHQVGSNLLPFCRTRCKKVLIDDKHRSVHLARKYTRTLGTSCVHRSSQFSLSFNRGKLLDIPLL